MMVTINGLIGLALVIALGILLARAISGALLVLCVILEAMTKQWRIMRRARRWVRGVERGHERK